MANNLVVQLLLKTGTFSTDLKQAGGQIQNFKKGCQTAGSTLTQFGKSIGINIGAITKLGTAAGVAVAAVKGFTAVMNSAQTTSDAMAGAVAGAKGVVEELKVSIATADFSGFTNGLWGIFDAAKNARDALDQLNNTTMSFGFLNKFDQYDFQNALNRYRDKHSTPEQKEAARKEMERIKNEATERAKNAVKVVEDAYKSVIVSKSGGNLNMNDVTLEGFKRVMSIDVSGDPKKARKYWDSQYDEYLRELKKYADKDKGRRELIGKYGDAIMAHTLLDKMSDKKLQEVLETAGKIPDFLSNAQHFETQYIRATNPDVPTTTTVKSTTTALKDQIVVQAESLEYWNKIAQETKKMRDAEVFDSEAWHSYNNQLQVAEGRIEEINNEMDKLEMKQRRIKNESLMTPLAQLNPITGVAVNTKQGGLAEDIKKDFESLSINELEAKIKRYTELAGEVKGNREQLAFYNKEIAKLRGRVEELQEVGVEKASVPTETIDTWDAFGNSLSNVATIASGLSTILRNVVDDDTAKQWEEFFNGVQKVVSVFSALASIIQAVTALQKTFEAVTAATAAANAASAATEAEAVVAAKGAEAGAAAAAAGAEGASAVAGIPFVGPALAIAAAAAIVIAVIAAMSKARSAGKFANGGIIGGSSFTGDRLTANVNSGEMILNRSQQARLFDIANGGAGGGQVEFHISGTELVGVLNNQTRKNRVIR